MDKEATELEQAIAFVKRYGYGHVIIKVHDHRVVRIEQTTVKEVKDKS